MFKRYRIEVKNTTEVMASMADWFGIWEAANHYGLCIEGASSITGDIYVTTFEGLKTVNLWMDYVNHNTRHGQHGIFRAVYENVKIDHPEYGKLLRGWKPVWEF